MLEELTSTADGRPCRPPPILRPHAEDAYAAELAALAAADDRPRPPSWRLSPWAVVTYLLGGALADGTVDHARSTSASAG